MNILARLRVTDIGPGGREQDVDIAEVSPALAGGVQNLAALCKPRLDVLNDRLALRL